MQRELLKNFQVGGAPLPDAIIDAILEEHGRDLEAAIDDQKEKGGTGGKTFNQAELNRSDSDRLAREREKQPKDDEREQALKAREARLDCRDYLDSKKYPASLLDVLDSSDVEKFKAAADALVGKFPAVASQEVPPPYAAGTGTGSFHPDMIADAFKPQT